MSNKILRTHAQIMDEFWRKEAEEPIIDSSTDDSDDEEVRSEHNTDSEEVTDSDDDIEVNPIETVFTSKNSFKWSAIPFHQIGYSRQENITSTYLPGVRPPATTAVTEISAFSLMFDDVTIKMIVDYTNKYIGSVRKNFTRERDAKPTDDIELKAFIGLLILSGVYKTSYVNYNDLWDTDGPTVFSMTMSESRFLFLLRLLRFDDLSTRQDRKKSDKLAPIRELVSMLGKNFEKYYSPSEYVTVDEQLIPFRGTCGFRQYIPNKPKQYGIKVFACVDARTFYLLSFEIYVGTQPDGENTAQNVVLRLVKPIENSSRNVTTDNWYTSVPLAKKLLEKKLTLVGTIKKNKPEIPNEFLPHKSKQVHSSIFGFTKDISLVSYVPRKSRAVILISSLHHDSNIDAESGEQQKPEILTFYNRTKGGVDTNDQLCATFNIGRRSKRWPIAVFTYLVNVSGINSFIIYKYNKFRENEVPVSRRTFLKNLGHELVKPLQIRRYKSGCLTKQLKLKMELYFEARKIQFEDLGGPTQPYHTISLLEEQPIVSNKRQRCYLCSRKNDNKYKTFCSTCKRKICKSHGSLICVSCLEK